MCVLSVFATGIHIVKFQFFDLFDVRFSAGKKVKALGSKLMTRALFLKMQGSMSKLTMDTNQMTAHAILPKKIYFAAKVDIYIMLLPFS